MSGGADRLDAGAVLERARAGTGLEDFGDATLPERFALCVEKLRKAGLDAEGRRAAAETCHGLLTTRLRFFEDRKIHPLAAERIARPIFATGEPRSGTTLLHALLSVDPNARALRFRDVMYPSPPPGLAGSEDRRGALADADWRDILRRIPKWIVSHPYNDMLGDGLPECERTWAFDFRAMTPTAWWRVPVGVDISGLPVDHAAQYRLHRMMLQACQHGRPERYWVLKGFHGARLKALFEAYPDARMIWTHRDPVQVMASRIVMMADIEQGLLGRADIDRIAAYYNGLSRQSIRATMESPLTDDPRIYHVRYRDFVADPVGTIRGFYEKIGVEFTGEAEAAMRAYLRDNPANRHGKFRYSTDVIGEDLEALDAEFAPYRERFGLEIERRR